MVDAELDELILSVAAIRWLKVARGVGQTSGHLEGVCGALRWPKIIEDTSVELLLWLLLMLATPAAAQTVHFNSGRSDVARGTLSRADAQRLSSRTYLGGGGNDRFGFRR